MSERGVDDRHRPATVQWLARDWHLSARMWLALAAALALLQPPEPPPAPEARPRVNGRLERPERGDRGDPLGPALDRVQREAQELQRRDLSRRDLTRHAVALRDQVAALPALNVPHGDRLATSQARLSRHAGRALSAAAHGDRQGARRAAGQVLGELDRLRLQLGRSPGEEPAHDHNIWAPK